MHYNSKTIVRELPHNLQSLGISLAKPPSASFYTAISRAAFKAKKLRQAMVSRTCLELNRQCTKLVKKKRSVVRSTSVQQLRTFRWSKLIREWRKEAPILYQFLKAASNATKAKSSLRPFIGAAGAILLKGRNQRLSAVQHLVGLCLFLGRTRKKVQLV